MFCNLKIKNLYLYTYSTFKMFVDFLTRECKSHFRCFFFFFLDLLNKRLDNSSSYVLAKFRLYLDSDFSPDS